MDFELKLWVPPALEINHSLSSEHKISHQFLVNWYIDGMLEKYFKINSAPKKTKWKTSPPLAHPCPSSVQVFKHYGKWTRSSTYAIFPWTHRCLSRRGANSGTIVGFLPQVGCSSCKGTHSAELFYVHVITNLLIEILNVIWNNSICNFATCWVAGVKLMQSY